MENPCGKLGLPYRSGYPTDDNLIRGREEEMEERSFLISGAQEEEEEDWNGDDGNNFRHEETECLDENGFPYRFMPSSSSPEFDQYANGDGGDGEQQKTRQESQENADEEEEGDSFVSNFYRSGTDWSCLMLSPPPVGEHYEEETNNKKKKKLKQTSLLHLWRIPPPSSSIESNLASAAAPSFFLNQNQTKNNKKKRSPSSACSSIIPPPQQPQPPRVCPFYKKLPGTNFTVDAFRYGPIKSCSAYFLTHFHADHYGGLTKRWSHGPIYCTPLTARLVRMCLYVDPSFLHPLEIDTEYVIEGVKVNMLEANHCPGAALIHFHLPNGQRFLHTGDFRASKQMEAYSLLRNQSVNVLYLDTTYCNPKYRFPSKEVVLNFVVRVTNTWMQKRPKTLVIVGAYSIGKESVYLAIAKALEVKIYANPSRRRILQSFGWPEICGNLCSNGKDTPLHVMPISSLKIEMLERYLKTYSGQYTAVLAFRPTGWTYSDTVGNHLELIKPNSRGSVTIYGVPYSEHSSFTELQEFVQFLRPDRVIPTVNIGNTANREKMQSYFREWQDGR